MKHLWFGEVVTGNEIDVKLENILSDTSRALEVELRVDYLLDVLNQFSFEIENDCERLASLLGKDFTQEESLEILKEIANFCRRDHLTKKIKRELGTEDLNDLTRIDFEKNIFESWAPLGVLTHITPGNSPGLSFLAIIEGTFGRKC